MVTEVNYDNNFDYPLFAILHRMKFFAHLRTAVQVLSRYKGQQPFGLFIKDFFRQDKKYGSRDRKYISQLCYAYFRLGKSFSALPVEERIVAGLFLCAGTPQEMLGQLHPHWNEQAALPLAQKFALIQQQVDAAEGTQVTDIFPWSGVLSTGMDHAAFCASFLVQPHLFLRLRPGKRALVTEALEAAGITFSIKEEHCLVLPNGSKVDEVIRLNRDAVIQDYNSQRVGEWLQLVPHGVAARSATKAALRVWDCCAASGGKSIMAWDLLGPLELTVSDIRESIIANLKKRFSEAGINRYQAFVADVAEPEVPIPLAHPPSLIIADVPCSGSGTWGRTPEQLYYFDTAAIARYQALQQRIAQRALEKLPPGGYFLYITCSVFRQENEDVAAFLQQQGPLETIRMELLKGYDQQADTLFAALLRKPA